MFILKYSTDTGQQVYIVPTGTGVTAKIKDASKCGGGGGGGIPTVGQI